MVVGLKMILMMTMVVIMIAKDQPHLSTELN